MVSTLFIRSNLVLVIHISKKVIELIRRPVEADGEWCDDKLHAGYKCRTDAGAGRRDGELPVWQRAHRAI